MAPDPGEEIPGTTMTTPSSLELWALHFTDVTDGRGNSWTSEPARDETQKTSHRPGRAVCNPSNRYQGKLHKDRASTRQKISHRPGRAGCNPSNRYQGKLSRPGVHPAQDHTSPRAARRVWHHQAATDRKEGHWQSETISRNRYQALPLIRGDNTQSSTWG